MRLSDFWEKCGIDATDLVTESERASDSHHRPATPNA